MLSIYSPSHTTQNLSLKGFRNKQKKNNKVSYNVSKCLGVGFSGRLSCVYNLIILTLSIAYCTFSGYLIFVLLQRFFFLFHSGSRFWSDKLAFILSVISVQSKIRQSIYRLVAKCQMRLVLTKATVIQKSSLLQQPNYPFIMVDGVLFIFMFKKEV